MTARPPKRAIFRFDASPEVGAGHAVRCLALAEALAADGWETAFATGPGAITTVPALAGHEVLEIDVAPDGEPGALEARWPGGCSLLVVDHYGRGAAFERACRPWCETVLAIDDLADRRHDCDLLLDQAAGRVAADYESLVPAGCRLLLGAAYVLLRPAFARMRGQTLPKDPGGPVERLFVSLGATDPYEVTARVLDGIAESGLEVDVDVALGSSTPRVDAVRVAAARLPVPARLYIDSKDIATLMAGADLAFGAGGISAWERCCLGLPTIMLVLADNQRQVAAALAAAGAASLLDGSCPSVAEIAGALTGLTQDATRRGTMAEAAAAMCDGRGVARVVMELRADIVDRDGSPVRLRPATIADGALTLAWQNDPGSRKYFRNPAAPTAEEHFAWLAENIRDPRCLLNVILHEGAPVGLLRFDRRVKAGAVVHEISILVAPQHRDRGIGKAALALGRRLLPGESLWAEVHHENAASAAMFRGAGFIRGNGGYVARGAA